MDEMSDGLIKAIGKRSKKLPGIHVKDAELQIHVPQPAGPHSMDEGTPFRSVLENYIDEVNALQHDADSEIQKLIAGESEDLHQLTLKMDEAEVTFEMMKEIRNKLSLAYQEVMRMQI